MISPLMSPRQRVLTTLNFQEPDRVPTAVGGGSYGIVDPLYFQLLNYYSLGEPVKPFRQGHNISYMDDRLLEKLGTDFRYVYPALLPSSPSQQTEDPDTFLDGFGQVWKRALPYYYAAKGLLSESVSLDDIDTLVHWPDVSDSRWTTGVRQRAQALYEGTDYFISARMVASHGPYQMACDLRGTAEFMMDLASNQEFASRLLERITETLTGLMKHYLDACGPYIQMIELPGDDYASGTNLLMSPGMFRKFIQPCLQKLVKVSREYNPDIKIMLHSDGAIRKLIPDLINLGIDVIHPLEPLPANDLDTIKTQFGDKISFIGGIDISHALPGSLEEVRSEVQRRISQLAPGGGYVLAPSNHIQADVPAENVAALFSAAQEYGRYPISQR